MMKFNYLSHISILTGLVFSLMTGCADHKDQVLAVVGNRTITADDFAARYQSIRDKLNLPDNGQVRTELLRTMVDEELLICQAIQKGYDRDPAGTHEFQRIKIQELLNTYHRKNITDHIQIHKNELENYYIRFNTRIKARHLYAPSKKQADSLYNEIMHGRTFQDLARYIYTDPKLRDTGGSLNVFTVDEMDPSFENAAFSLDIGRISPPVRTAQGYSIIQVEDRITKPLLTETDFLKQRPALEKYVRHRKIMEATQKHVDSLRQILKISFYDPAVKELLGLLSQRRAVSATTLSNEDISSLPDDESFLHKKLVQSELGIWDIRTFQKYVQFTSEGQRRWIRNQENLEDFIAGLVIRAHMLARASELGYEKSETFAPRIKHAFDDYLLKRMEGEISVSTAQIREQANASFEPELKRAARQQMLNSLRSQIKTVTYPENLKSMHLEPSIHKETFDDE
jgi:parvulin-like peptidyl-prolyl isomerase